MVAIHLQTIPLTQLLPRSAASAEAMRVKEEKQEKKEEDGYRLWGNDETEAMKKVGAKDEEQAEVGAASRAGVSAAAPDAAPSSSRPRSAASAEAMGVKEEKQEEEKEEDGYTLWENGATRTM